MPVRSLNSSVMVWPNRETVLKSLQAWLSHQESVTLIGLGVFGSYARGDYGVGSDLDLILIVSECDLPPQQRSPLFDFNTLPVSVEYLVYTEAEWQRLMASADRFAQTLKTEMEWILPLNEPMT